MSGQRPRPETLEGKTPAEQRAIVARTANLPAPAAWRISERGMESLSMFRSINKTQHGICRCAIICKGESLYAHVCAGEEVYLPLEINVQRRWPCSWTASRHTAAS